MKTILAAAVALAAFAFWATPATAQEREPLRESHLTPVAEEFATHDELRAEDIHLVNHWRYGGYYRPYYHRPYTYYRPYYGGYYYSYPRYGYYSYPYGGYYGYPYGGWYGGGGFYYSRPGFGIGIGF